MINPVLQQLKLINSKAVAKHKEGQKEKAIALYLKSLELDKNQPAWIYGNVITLLAEVGQVEQGLGLKEQALKTHPSSDEVYRAIGLALNRQGDRENGISYYLKALDIDNNQPDWLYSSVIENLGLQNQFQQAVASSHSRRSTAKQNNDSRINHYIAFDELWIPDSPCKTASPE